MATLKLFSLLLLFLFPVWLFSDSLPKYPKHWQDEFTGMAAAPVVILGFSTIILSETIHLTNIKDNADFKVDNAENYILFGDIIQYTGLGYFVYHSATQNPLIGLVYLNSWLFSGIFSLGIKVIRNEKRPNGGHYGFPSGHVSVTASSLGAAISLRDTKAIILNGVFSAFSAWSRLLSGKRKAYHSIHQVIAGLLLGLTVGYYIGDEIKQNYNYSYSMNL